MAAIWEGVVCRMYDVNNWKFFKSGHSYVLSNDEFSVEAPRADRILLGFVAFDQYKSMLQDADGNISGPRTVIAGFGAGVTESLLAVTPFESIKTTLYEYFTIYTKGIDTY